MKRATLAMLLVAVLCTGCGSVPCFRGVLHLETCAPASAASHGADSEGSAIPSK